MTKKSSNSAATKQSKQQQAEERDARCCAEIAGAIAVLMENRHHLPVELSDGLDASLKRLATEVRWYEASEIVRQFGGTLLLNFHYQIEQAFESEMDRRRIHRKSLQPQTAAVQ